MIKNKKSDKANLENKKNMFFLIGLVLALSAVLFAFEWKTSETSEVTDFGQADLGDVDWVFIPSTPAAKKELPKPVISLPDLDIVDNSTNVEEFDMIFEEPEDPVSVDFNSLIFQPANNENNKDEEIIIIAEVMPEFPGGERALINYLSTNVKYPLIAQENGIEGKVYVSFVVDEEGNIYDVTILRGVDTSLDNEALRVVRGMPRWKPGKQGGKPVKVRYNVPIYFELR